MPFRYVFDPISGSFTMTQVREVQVPPYWENTSNPPVRKYIEKFGPPPKGMTTYEMKLALEEDERRYRKLAEEQFWTLIQLGEYTEAEQLASESPYLGLSYANKARQLFDEHREKVLKEREAKRFEGWVRDPYIQMVLEEKGVDPRTAYLNPQIRSEVEELAVAKARKLVEDYKFYGPSSPQGQLYHLIDREYDRLHAMGLGGYYKAIQAHEKGNKPDYQMYIERGSGAAVYDLPSGEETYQKPGSTGTFLSHVVKDPATGVAYELYPDKTPISYELDPNTGYVVPVYADTGMAKQIGSPASPDAYGSSSHKKPSEMSNEEFYQTFGVPKGILY